MKSMDMVMIAEKCKLEINARDEALRRLTSIPAYSLHLGRGARRLTINKTGY